MDSGCAGGSQRREQAPRLSLWAAMSCWNFSSFICNHAQFLSDKIIGCIAFNFCYKAGFEDLISSYISEYFSVIILQQTCKKWCCKILSVLSWGSFSSIKVNHLIPVCITARCELCWLKARTDDHVHRSHISNHFTCEGKCRWDSTWHMKLIPP